MSAVPITYADVAESVIAPGADSLPEREELISLLRQEGLIGHFSRRTVFLLLQQIMRLSNLSK